MYSPLGVCDVFELLPIGISRYGKSLSVESLSLQQVGILSSLLRQTAQPSRPSDWSVRRRYSRTSPRGMFSPSFPEARLCLSSGERFLPLLPLCGSQTAVHSERRRHSSRLLTNSCQMASAFTPHLFCSPICLVRVRCQRNLARLTKH